MKRLIVLGAFAGALLLAVPAQASSSECADPATAPVDIERTIEDFFDALRQEDKAPFKRLTTPSFYAFDVGERFPDSSLADAVRSALDKGVEINWMLGPMDTKVRCNIAWSQWENSGSAGTPPDVRPIKWLESAVLVHQDGRWKLDFFHSQRANPE
ncbi:hypothetical protein [Qipengyuania sp. ASV99]|uniref:hypothetical protein n=1 Tax=Qipengyuania sp. ASV99 TaxID=3399681 RepID=UPI003A4C5DF1